MPQAPSTVAEARAAFDPVASKVMLDARLAACGHWLAAMEAAPKARDAATLAEAQSLCEELGLGPLLERMPAGLQQRVGETGWQLSHGERSRVFLARALRQKAPLTILDESFAALDPQTLRRCLDTALRHMQAKGRVWFARREDIARHWLAHLPPA